MIKDLDKKHRVFCRSDNTEFMLLWRSKGKGSKPLPKVGDLLPLIDGDVVVKVVRIEAPADEVPTAANGGGTLVFTNG